MSIESRSRVCRPKFVSRISRRRKHAGCDAPATQLRPVLRHRGAQATARTARRLAGPVLLSAVIVSLMLAVPPLRGVARQVAHAQAGWVVAAIVLELCSCVAFIMIFRLF